MKIDLIGQALSEIKEEDQNDLSELEEALKKMEEEYSLRQRNVSQLEKEHESLQELENLSQNLFSHIHMILPVFELPLGIGICWLAVLIPFSLPLTVALFVFGVLSEVDAAHTLIDRYPNIMGDCDECLMSYAKAFKRLFLNKKDLRRTLIKAYNKLLCATDETTAYGRELSRVKNKASSLKKDLLHVESYIDAIEYIVEKQYFEELRDTTDIVQFINRKKELKKVVSE